MARAACPNALFARTPRNARNTSRAKSKILIERQGFTLSQWWIQKTVKTFLLQSTSLTDTRRAHYIHASSCCHQRPGNIAQGFTPLLIPGPLQPTVAVNFIHSFLYLSINILIIFRTFMFVKDKESIVLFLWQISSLWTIIFLLEDLFSLYLLKFSLWYPFIL